jgi:chaperonin GroES
MNLNPLHDRVVIQLAEPETTTPSGIVIPDNAKEKPSTGQVVAVGTGRVFDNGTKVPLTVKVGNTVMFGKHTGQSVKVNGEEYTILREEDIFAIVE